MNISNHFVESNLLSLLQIKAAENYNWVVKVPRGIISWAVEHITVIWL